MRKIFIVAGTRPEVIKLAPVVLAARKRSTVRAFFCSTGQHEVMARAAMAMFGITEDENLAIMKPGQTVNDVAAAVFQKLPSVLADEGPDVVLVQGDTTSAAAAAMTAFNMKIPVAHVEAGLRSFDLEAPFPEEANRRFISVVSKYNLCPTETARQHLLNEGTDPETLFVTGNTVVDALEYIRSHHGLDDIRSIDERIRAPFALVTAHRRESFGQGFEQICRAIRDAARSHPKMQFVYPVHLNPNVDVPVRKLLGDLENVLLLAPVGYLPLLTLLNGCAFVVTDSGGVQEEAPSFGKYCIVLRDVTERMESVDAGISELVGTDPSRIVSAIDRQVKHRTVVRADRSPYGDGKASERILSILEST